jgi:hypothetical protein
MSRSLYDGLREEIAQAVYELDPLYKSGEYVDGFQVSPGGELTWEQTKARDAEFGGLPGFISVTEYPYRVADKVTSLLLARETSVISRSLYWLGVHRGNDFYDRLASLRRIFPCQGYVMLARSVGERTSRWEPPKIRTCSTWTSRRSKCVLSLRWPKAPIGSFIVETGILRGQ